MICPSLQWRKCTPHKIKSQPLPRLPSTGRVVNVGNNIFEEHFAPSLGSESVEQTTTLSSSNGMSRGICSSILGDEATAGGIVTPNEINHTFMLGNSEVSSDDPSSSLNPTNLSSKFQMMFVERVLSGPSASITNNRRLWWMLEGTKAAYSEFDFILVFLEPSPLLNTIRPDVDEKHRNRMEGAVGKVQSWKGSVSLVRKQDRVEEEVPALSPQLSYGSVEAITAHTDRLQKAKGMVEKAGKMKLVEEALPQPNFKKGVSCSVLSRRQQAEEKHRARLARGRH
jgi:hypothetical protein